jgi:hypothetical protein
MLKAEYAMRTRLASCTHRVLEKQQEKKQSDAKLSSVRSLDVGGING